MANYIFETMTADDAAAFTSSDTLRFSNANATPGTVVFTENLGNIAVTSGDKTLTFLGAGLADGEILFASSFNDGSATTVFLGSASGDNFAVGNTDDGNYAYGFSGADTVAGNTGDDFLFGGTGADSVNGLDGNDYAFGGAGNDIIVGDSGADHLYGFALTGTFSLDGDDNISGGTGNDYLQGNAGADTLSGGSENDRINGGADNDVINGDSGNDSANGNKGEDTLDGGSGNDTLRGGADNDLLFGGEGNDVILGDLGSDEIRGGDGIDVLTGGAGADTFVFSSGDASYEADAEDSESDVYFVFDAITDFGTGDILDLTNMGIGNADDSEDAVVIKTSTSTVGSVQDAAAIAIGLLDDVDTNTVAKIQVGSDTYVFYNGGDEAIKLVGVAAADVTASDFAELSA